MKSKKNLILGLLAFVFAVGSAFSSILAPVNAHLNVRFVGEASAQCRDTGVDCDDLGGQPCTVSFLYDPDGSGPITPTIASAQAKYPMCAAPLTHSDAIAESATWTQTVQQVIN